MLEAAAVERRADRADHAVHHAAGSDDVGPGLGVADGLLAEQLERGVVVDIHPAGVVVDHAAVAVIGVFAEADVGDDEQVRRGVLRRLHRLLDDAAVAVRIAAERRPSRPECRRE